MKKIKTEYKNFIYSIHTSIDVSTLIWMNTVDQTDSGQYFLIFPA